MAHSTSVNKNSCEYNINTQEHQIRQYASFPDTFFENQNNPIRCIQGCHVGILSTLLGL
jgi:hypothetical protein